MKEQAIPGASRVDLLFWFIGVLRRRKVTGNSMLPTLKPGEELLVSIAKKRRREIAVGDIVIIPHPDQKEVKMIKRVAQIIDDSLLDLRGDNPSESDDSRTFGLFHRQDVIGVVVSRFE